MTKTTLSLFDAMQELRLAIQRYSVAPEWLNDERREKLLDDVLKHSDRVRTAQWFERRHGNEEAGCAASDEEATAPQETGWVIVNRESEHRFVGEHRVQHEGECEVSVWSGPDKVAHFFDVTSYFRC